MAGLKLCVCWEDVLLVVGSWKTVGSIRAGSDQKVQLEGSRLATDGIAGDAKSLEFRIQPVTAGSGTGTAITPSKVQGFDATTPRSIARVNFSAEPTATANAVLCQDKFHPQGGEWQDFTFKDVYTAAAGEVAVQVKVPSGQVAVNCSGHLWATE
jgi:hypothetical protein